MWRTPCVTLLPFATAATYICAQRPTSQCESQRLGTGAVEPSAELKLVQVVFRCVTLQRTASACGQRLWQSDLL